MARIRSIKPEFWEDEKIGSLPIPCRLFYIGLWNLADDQGVFRANSSILKSRIFPYDENLRVSEISKWLDALVKAQMIIPISYKNESYYIIRTFRDHQKFDPRYPNNLIPKEIADNILNNESGHIDNPVGPQRVPSVHPPREGEGEEGYIESKDSFDEFSFEAVWAMYEKKGTSKVARSRWDKLPKTKKQLALKHIPLYVQATPEKKYRKNFEKYLSQEAWNDEIFTFDQNKSSDLGEGVWVENGKKYYGDKNNPREIPMSAPKRPGKQYAYDREKNNWTIL
jgi:hypothetical protein